MFKKHVDGKFTKAKLEIIWIITEESLKRRVAEKCKVVDHFRYLGVYLADPLKTQ